LRAPILGYQPGGFQVTSFDGAANYSSLQVTVRKQLTRGLLLQASYTWSKDLSDMFAANAVGNGGNSNLPSDLWQQYGPVSFNHPQRFIVNYSYDLPVRVRNRIVGIATNGWSVQGVTTVQNGTPITPLDSRGGTVYGFGNYGQARAQMCPGTTYSQMATSGGIESRLGGKSGGPGYLNTAAFCAPPVAPNSPDNSTLFGNSGVGTLLGPGQFNWDISLIKNARFLERHQIQFRAEFFNAFNHAQFANPGSVNVNSPSNFGQITSTITNPRILQFALKYNF
jgi:hypothetical protein